MWAGAGAIALLVVSGSDSRDARQRATNTVINMCIMKFFDTCILSIG